MKVFTEDNCCLTARMLLDSLATVVPLPIRFALTFGDLGAF